MLFVIFACSSSSSSSSSSSDKNTSNEASACTNCCEEYYNALLRCDIESTCVDLRPDDCASYETYVMEEYFPVFEEKCATDNNVDEYYQCMIDIYNSTTCSDESLELDIQGIELECREKFGYNEPTDEPSTEPASESYTGPLPDGSLPGCLLEMDGVTNSGLYCYEAAWITEDTCSNSYWKFQADGCSPDNIVAVCLDIPANGDYQDVSDGYFYNGAIATEDFCNDMGGNWKYIAE